MSYCQSCADLQTKLTHAEQRIAELEKKLNRAETCIVAHAEREHDSGMLIAEQNDKLAGKQARIDALMLEYCPDEMTTEQVDEWGRHQRPVTTTSIAPATPPAPGDAE